MRCVVAAVCNRTAVASSRCLQSLTPRLSPLLLLYAHCSHPPPAHLIATAAMLNSNWKALVAADKVQVSSDAAARECRASCSRRSRNSHAAPLCLHLAAVAFLQVGVKRKANSLSSNNSGVGASTAASAAAASSSHAAAASTREAVSVDPPRMRCASDDERFASALF